MGSGKTRGARPPSTTAYYVALAGILGLLLLLCCYFVYFCIRRVKKLTQQGLPERVESVRPPPPDTVAYPVQPAVRASASAMARLCHSPSRGVPPTSPRSLVSPSRDRFVSAQRSSSLTPAHTDTVHPRTRSQLPPPNILTSRTTPIRNGPKVIPPRIELVSNEYNVIGDGTPTPKKRLSSPKSQNFSPHKSKETLPVWKDEASVRRREGITSKESQRKHLSAPPQIVVGDVE
ncbi:unnamed protein product [Pieris macdunnoughi]|uniref:Uncharacterized protein n=1 Tax=Pieris macdunnoughi TaxID=345717 RepID=A0A821Y6K6_9NEOP|nr:unnamed protein product [Pieris macdunnoughi]